MAPDHDALLAVRIQPRVRADAVIGERDGAIVIRLKAPPVDGAANAALLRFVAARLGVPPRDVELVRGTTGRSKLLRVHGLSSGQARAALLG